MIPPKPAAEGGWGWKKERKSTLRQHCLTFWAEVCCMSVDIDDYDYNDDDDDSMVIKEGKTIRLAIG